MESYFTKTRMPLPELRKSIKALKRLDLRHSDIDSIKRALAPLLHHYVHSSPLIQAGERIFRAVFLHNRPTHKSHMGYPPANKVGHGRRHSSQCVELERSLETNGLFARRAESGMTRTAIGCERNANGVLTRWTKGFGASLAACDHAFRFAPCGCRTTPSSASPHRHPPARGSCADRARGAPWRPV
jgi:hypothetical protein